MAKTPRLFLIDGSALAYRSYFAFIRNPLINSKGEKYQCRLRVYTHAARHPGARKA